MPASALPDDPRLRAHAVGIAEERRHFLKTAGVQDDGEGDDCRARRHHTDVGSVRPVRRER